MSPRIAKNQKPAQREEKGGKGRKGRSKETKNDLLVRLVKFSFCPVARFPFSPFALPCCSFLFLRYGRPYPTSAGQIARRSSLRRAHSVRHCGSPTPTVIRLSRSGKRGLPLEHHRLLPRRNG